MALFGSLDRRRPGPSAGGLTLWEPGLRHFENWRSLRKESREFLTPWEPRWPDDDLTIEGYRRRLRRYRRESELGLAITWFIFRDLDGSLLGGLTYSAIRHGASRSCQLGYWMGERHAGQGYMTRAVDLSVREMLELRGMERVEAACVPENERSIALLERNNFRREGYLREYLEINGVRRDHYIYALLKREYRPLQDGQQVRVERQTAGKT